MAAFDSLINRYGQSFIVATSDQTLADLMNSLEASSGALPEAAHGYLVIRDGDRLYWVRLAEIDEFLERTGEAGLHVPLRAVPRHDPTLVAATSDSISTRDVEDVVTDGADQIVILVSDRSTGEVLGVLEDVAMSRGIFGGQGSLMHDLFKGNQPVIEKRVKPTECPNCKAVNFPRYVTATFTWVCPTPGCGQERRVL